MILCYSTKFIFDKYYYIKVAMFVHISRYLPALGFFFCIVWSVFATFCPNDCSGHGTCELDGNICECWPGWNTGIPDCSLSKFYYLIINFWLCV